LAPPGQEKPAGAGSVGVVWVGVTVWPATLAFSVKWYIFYSDR